MNNEYSAGAVSKGFWFQSFRKYNDYLSNGLSDDEIKEKQEKENIFLAPSKSYGKKMVNEISKRVKNLPQEIIELMPNLLVQDQKLVNLLGVMLTDKLFFEFMNEVYRNKLNFENYILLDSEIKIFFKNKEEQSEKVRDFKDQTKRRLIGTYKTYLREAGLAIDENNEFKLKKPILDMNLEKSMKIELNPYLKIYLGE